MTKCYKMKSIEAVPSSAYMWRLRLSMITEVVDSPFKKKPIKLKKRQLRNNTSTAF